MPTAIRQVDLSESAAAITGLRGYDRCMVLFHWRGVPAGRAFVTVREGQVGTAALRHAARSLGYDATRVWLEDALGFDGRDRFPASERPAVTVAICTRERPDDLARALDAVARLAPAADEVIVVDNAPITNATADVLRRFPRVRYIVEPRRGLDCARNRALAEAAGAIVAFTDDDAVPEPGWLDALLHDFTDPRVLMVTGLTLPVELETAAQERFEEHSTFVRGFARRVFNGRVDHPLLVSRIGAGANMAVRRTLPDVVGGFDERLDAGTPTESGGDHEMFTRILSAGYRIVYEPRAVSWHRHRRTDAELLRVVRGYGIGVYAMWTGRLVEHGDLGVLRLAWRWFRHDHVPVLRRPSRWRSGGRDALRRAELAGALRGPFAWFRSSRAVTRV